MLILSSSPQLPGVGSSHAQPFADLLSPGPCQPLLLHGQISKSLSGGNTLLPRNCTGSSSSKGCLRTCTEGCPYQALLLHVPSRTAGPGHNNPSANTSKDYPSSWVACFFFFFTSFLLLPSSYLPSSHGCNNAKLAKLEPDDKERRNSKASV